MKQVWAIDELSKYWSLEFEEIKLLKSKPERNHLGFAIQLKYYQYTGQFPKLPSDIAKTVLHYLCDQLDDTLPELSEYDWSGRSGNRHRQEILAFLEIKRVSTGERQPRGCFSRELSLSI